MTVLTDHEIIDMWETDLIEPFNVDQVQPASYDVQLGDTFRTFMAHRTKCVDLSDPRSFATLTEEMRVRQGRSFILHPGQFALGRTFEIFHIPDNLVMRLEGKSSLARLGLSIHQTGGYIDPGFKGTVTLEFVNELPVPMELWPGQLIAQVSFMRMASQATRPYGSDPATKNHYQNQIAATASRFGHPLADPDSDDVFRGSDV